MFHLHIVSAARRDRARCEHLNRGQLTVRLPLIKSLYVSSHEFDDFVHVFRRERYVAPRFRLDAENVGGHSSERKDAGKKKQK